MTSPRELARALDELEPEVWTRIARRVFGEPAAARCEFRVCRTASGRLIGVSRADFDRDTIRRALVIASSFQGSAESLELTAAELAAYFSRGVRAVEYSVPVSHAVATARVRLLGAEQVGAPVYGHQAWRLSADSFDRDALRAVAERRTHAQDQDPAKRV